MKTNNVRRSILFTAFGGAAIALAACTNPEVKPPASPTPAPVATASPAVSPSVSPAANAAKVDALVGRWTGAEGAYLNIAKKGDKFSLEIKNLDGLKTFEGSAKGDVIEFTRNGKTETVKPASGAETGIKDLEKETQCVVITKGSEGFCKK